MERLEQRITELERGVEQRVTELERRASRYRNALVLLVVGLCAVAVVGATNEGRWGIDENGVITGKHLRIFVVYLTGKIGIDCG